MIGSRLWTPVVNRTWSAGEKAAASGSRNHTLKRSVAMALLAAAFTALVALAPHALRRMDAFRVTRVEVIGTRHLAPHRAIEVSGITAGDNLFDDAAAWRSALERLPVVRRVEFGRRLPGTLVLQIAETRPVAWIRTPELRMVTAEGRLLPVDPAGGDADLPVLSLTPAEIEDGRVRTGHAMKVIRFLADLREAEPRLAARISEVRAAGAATVRLILRLPEGTEMLLPLDIGANRMRAARLTLADLARRDEIGRVELVDLRFRDQVVVSFRSNRAG